MRSTLFYIPHQVAGIPMFGFGALLVLVWGGYIAWAAYTYSKTRSSAELTAALPVVLVASAVLVFLLPSVEQKWHDGTAIGLPIRGYGVMVVAGLFCGVGITVLRAKQLGLSVDDVIGLGFWMMLTGVIGARVFFVVQKWSEFNSITDVFKLTEGGLVIYGGVIGGLLAGITFCWQRNLNVLAMADLIAPGFLIGQSLGRIGCLLHGCCFGGICTAELPSIQFPQGSLPYQSQLASGRLLGVELESQFPPSTIKAIKPNSLASQRGFKEGASLSGVYVSSVEKVAGNDPVAAPQMFAEAQVGGRTISFLPSQLPSQSLETHPSQIYSAINAALLCVLIWFLQPFASRDGMVFCIAILLYTSSRFLMELVRSDEASQLGTGLTIAQLFSIAAIVTTGLGLLWLNNMPAKRAWHWAR